MSLDAIPVSDAIASWRLHPQMLARCNQPTQPVILGTANFRHSYAISNWTRARSALDLNASNDKIHIQQT
jgi:hypothetical protein